MKIVLIILLGIQLMAKQDSTAFKKPSIEILKKTLTSEQYRCTQESDTEKPFHNLYWNFKDDGIYVDVVSGEALFSSLDKYDSGSGWPSFTRSIEKNNLVFKADNTIGFERVEVRSKSADSHLGHVFDDGPKDAGGKRFCMNSAALKFVPLDKMKKEGYGSYLFGFADKKKWKTALFAAGCFWGVEEIFRKIHGVIETEVGYTGGQIKNPIYDLVKIGATGHAEAVHILYDSKVTNYEKLLELFFKLHDPTTENRQGNDVGTQYRSAIFFTDDEQLKLAEKFKEKVQKSGAWKKPLVTQILKAQSFYPAEPEHQKYLEKHPQGYTCHFIRDLKF